MNAERETFLRKLEDGYDEQTVPGETRLFLANVGLDTSAIDPASMRALEELLGSKTENRMADATSEIAKQSECELDQPVAEISTSRRFHRAASDITMTGLMTNTDMNSAATVCNETSRDDVIVQHLKNQTALILQMQSRIEDLTEKVNFLVSDACQGGRIHQSQQQQQHLHPTRETRETIRRTMQEQVNQPLHEPMHDFRDAALRQQREIPLPNRPPRRSLFATLCDFFGNLYTGIRNSRAVEVMRVFVTLHRRHVRFDVALMFKVVLMVTIFSAKFMSRAEKEGEISTGTKKLSLVMGMVFIGFMIQSGYITFLYRFFVEHKLFQRIYGGEIIDIDGLTWNHQTPQRNNQNGNLRNMIPRHQAVRGNVHAPRNGLNILVDILVLIGSFLLSILPIWKPEGQPQERQARMAEIQAHPRGGMNAVAPPPDLDQHAADEDDDDLQPNED